MAAQPQKSKRRALPDPADPPVVPQDEREECDKDFYVVRLDTTKAFQSRVMAFALRHEFTFRSSDTFMRFKEFFPGMDYNAYRISVIARQATRSQEDIELYEAEFNRYIDESLEAIGDIYEKFFSLKRDDNKKRRELIAKVSVQGSRRTAVYTIAPHSKRILRFFQMADDALVLAHYRWLNGEIQSDQLSTIAKEINRTFRLLAQRLTLVSYQCFSKLKRLSEERKRKQGERTGKRAASDRTSKTMANGPVPDAKTQDDDETPDDLDEREDVADTTRDVAPTAFDPASSRAKPAPGPSLAAE